jgi:L-lactate dehydrogenase complex protein LldF
MADAAMRDVLAVVRCGACINVCPVYAHVGGHSYGSAYCGPMGSLLAPLLARAQGAPEAATLAELPFACTTCGACASVCPVRIDHPTLLLELRRRAAASPYTATWRPWAPAAPRPSPVGLAPGLWRAAPPRTQAGPELRLARCIARRGHSSHCGPAAAAPRLRAPFSARWGTLRRSLEDSNG